MWSLARGPRSTLLRIPKFQQWIWELEKVRQTICECPRCMAPNQRRVLHLTLAQKKDTIIHIQRKKVGYMCMERPLSSWIPRWRSSDRDLRRTLTKSRIFVTSLPRGNFTRPGPGRRRRSHCSDQNGWWLFSPVHLRSSLGPWRPCRAIAI